jgi:RNA polymerase sigma-70 factor (ECF subfamily)
MTGAHDSPSSSQAGEAPGAHGHRTPGSDGFATTRWSLVADAGDATNDAGREALSVLCHSYWLPLYAYVRRRVASEHEAQDLTQGFFARILERNDVAAARQDRGRFRAYLLTALKHYLANEWEKARALKRGGGKAPLSLDMDFRDGETRLHLEPGDPTTPEQAYERQWATTVLGAVFTRLREESVHRGDETGREERAARFDALKPFLAGAMPRGSTTEVAQTLGMSETAVRTAVARLRDRYREILRSEIAQTVRDSADVDEEIAGLFAAVRPAPRIL